jgi:hypothetical protein
MIYLNNHIIPSVATFFFSPCSFEIRDCKVADLSGVAKNLALIF